MYRIEMVAPAGTGTWGVELHGDADRPNKSFELTPDECDELELALACRRAQLGEPRLTGVVRGLAGHRFDDAHDAIGFTEATLRQYDDGALAVIVTRDGERFPFDEKVEVTSP